MVELTGLFNAIVTPFDADRNFNEQAFRELIDFQVAGGIKGLFVCGGGGEGVLMNTAERKRVAEVAVDHLGDRGRTLVHIGSLSTLECLELAQHAESIGATAVGALPPFFFGTDDDSLVYHYAQIVKSTSLPVFAYHLPPMTHIYIYADLMERLMSEAGVVGIKYTDFDLFQMRRLMDCGNGSCQLLYGRDEQLVPALVMGAKGGIGSTYNMMPNLYGRMWSEWEAGDLKAATQTQLLVQKFTGLLLRYRGLPAVKVALNLLGYEAGECRPPLRPLTQDESAAFQRELEQLGYFDLVKKV